MATLRHIHDTYVRSYVHVGLLSGVGLVKVGMGLGALNTLLVPCDI